MPIRIAEDVTVYPLDQAGILFSESRQEIFGLNTNATFIWFCLEDGLSLDEIAREYSEAFGTPVKEGRDYVSTALEQWQAAGFLWGIRESDTNDLCFNTALGRLLTNSVLRQAFREAPKAIAQSFNLRGDDYAAFIALDPDQVDTHARLLITKKLGRRHAPRMNAEASKLYRYSQERALPLGKDAPIRRYALLNTRIILRFSSSEVCDLLDSAFSHLEANFQTGDVQFDLILGEEKFLLLEDSQPVRHCASVRGVVPMVNAAIRQVVANRQPHFMHLHAGVVSDGKTCVLLPGSPGSGKTTLTAALSQRGYQYYSDEIALLEENNGIFAWPAPICMTIKSGSLAALASYFPKLDLLPTHIREDGIEVRYLRPVDCNPLVIEDQLKPVSAIVFPKFESTTATTLEPISKARALSLLLEECMAIPNLLRKKQLSNFITWLESIDCYALTFSDLEKALGLLARRVS